MASQVITSSNTYEILTNAFEKMLLKDTDNARNKNGIGFNKYDSIEIKNDLKEIADITPEFLRKHGYRLSKYEKQLTDMGIDFEKIKNALEDIKETKKSTYADAFKEQDEPDKGKCMLIDLFFNSIKGVEKIKPVTENKTADYRFTFNFSGKKATFTMSLSDLKKKDLFDDRLFSYYGIHAPYELMKKAEKGEPNQWRTFIDMVDDMAEERDPEESQAWLEADIVLSKLTNFNVTDLEIWANKNTKNRIAIKSFDGKQYGLIKSADMLDLIKESRLTMPAEVVGNALNQMGFKRNKNPSIEVKGVQTGRNWWILLSVLTERGLNPNPVGKIKLESTKIEGGF